MKHISQIIADMSAQWQKKAGIETPEEALSLTKKQDWRKMESHEENGHEDGLLQAPRG
jgi:hypothetical protein